ncbi:MAG: PQQ-binding-like beta-propeller repeat protein [Thermoguttaceae bacterium]|jgi:outer membrane protein assembly factor BamB
MNKLNYAKRICGVSLGLAILALCVSPASASDWPRFHGPDGNGISPDAQPLPVKWSDTENLQWKCKLPGPGSSSPIVVGRRVLVTCWTGYGLDRDNVGDQQDLRRHLICLDRASGKVLWDKSIEPVLPEDPYSGNFTQHGYASHTPVSDGQRVYAFFGKTGVLAFDLEGKKLWQTGVGTGSGTHGWGTASSPILYKDLVIVPAFAESESLVALNKETGEEVWRRKEASFASTWGTPILVECGKERTDLVIMVPAKIWGLNPDDGKVRWQCEGLSSDSICASAFAHYDVVYAMETGPRGGGTMAVRAGGEGDVTKSNVFWRGSERSRIGTPVLDDGRIYWFGNRTANCVDAATGKPVYQSRVGGGATAAEAPKAAEPGPGPGPGQPGRGGPGRRPGGGFGGRGGRGGGMMGQDYSSPVLANGKIFFLSRTGEAFVYATGPEFKLLGQNRFGSDGGDFSATPAVSDGQLFIRSSKYLYCVADSARRKP